MLYSQNVKNFISGISQQPPILRLPEQLEEQINGFSTESSGLQKRPPTIHVSNLSDKIEGEPLVHFINRDKYEKYIMYFKNNGLEVFDLDGNRKEVIYETEEDREYLKVNEPQNDIRVITIADYTFVVNRNVTVKMLDEKTPDAFHTQGALIHVQQGQYGRTYKIWCDDKLVAEHTTADGSDKSHTKLIDTAYIAQQLAESARGNGCTVDVGDSWLRIHNVQSVKTQDGFNNQAMTGFVSTAQKFSKLPSTAPEGYLVKVVGDPDSSNAGAYYTHYDSEDKVWRECAAPDIIYKYDLNTMPHALVRNGDGTFTFKKVEWAERECGDDDSNPLPSFVDKTINDIFFYRNRLGVLAGENVILSESAEYFNFWQTTANDVLDTDCIDVPTTTTRINILNYAVPFNQDLYCFSDSTQFRLGTDTVLSPKNVALVEVTSFNSSPDCRPQVAGKNLYFPSERAEYTSIKEYYSVQQVSDEKNAQDISSHVASFIPNGVYQIAVNTNENIMLYLTSGDKQKIYVYKYLWLNEQRVQASWSVWDMGADVFGVFFVSSTLYVLINRGDKQVLEKMHFTYNTADFKGVETYRVYLDSKIVASNLDYDDVYERSRINLKELWGLEDISFINRVGVVQPNKTYKIFEKDEIDADGNIYLDGHITEDVIVGIPYNFKITLSPIYMRVEEKNGGQKALTNGRLQIRTLKVNYSDTGGFVVYVNSNNHQRSYRMTSKQLNKVKAGELPLTTGTLRIPIQMLNTAYTCSIESDMPVPVSLIGYLWEGNWVAKSRGV